MESRAKITERYLLFSIQTLLKFSLCRTLSFFLCEWPSLRLILLVSHSKHRFKTDLFQFQIPRKNNLIGGTRLNSSGSQRWLTAAGGGGYRRLLPEKDEHPWSTPKCFCSTQDVDFDEVQGSGTVFPHIFSSSTFDYKLL